MTVNPTTTDSVPAATAEQVSQTDVDAKVAEFLEMQHVEDEHEESPEECFVLDARYGEFDDVKTQLESGDPKFYLNCQDDNGNSATAPICSVASAAIRNTGTPNQIVTTRA